MNLIHVNGGRRKHSCKVTRSNAEDDLKLSYLILAHSPLFFRVLA